VKLKSNMFALLA